MEVAVSILCAILVGLVLYMVQKSESRYDKLERRLEDRLQTMAAAIQGLSTELAVLRALQKERDGQVS